MAEEERRVVQLSSQQIKLRKICAYISICVCVAEGGGVTNHKIPCPPALWISVRLGSNAF